MRKSTKKRFWRIVLFAALALMLWLFDLTILAWVFAALVLLPVLIGGLIWLVQSKNGYHKPKPQHTRENFEKPPSRKRPNTTSIIKKI